MATKYAEGVLAICYRSVDKETGHVLGGPFYYIENGMGKKWRWLGKIFAFFGAGVGLLGIGTFTQVNGITSAVGDFLIVRKPVRWRCWKRVYGGRADRRTDFDNLCLHWWFWWIGAYCYCFPDYRAVYGCLLCGCMHYDFMCKCTKVPMAFKMILESAFGLRPAAGGALGSILLAMQKGIARGIFSNEAGLGSAPIAAAAARTREPVRQGLVSMTGTVYRYDYNLYHDRSFNCADRSL